MASDSNSSGVEPPWPAENGIWATYNLHCHCGAVRYKMTVSPPIYESEAQGKDQYPLTECHCSHCERHGALMIHPLATNFEWTQGFEENATEYRSASQQNPHYHCKKCGNFLATDIAAIMKNVFNDKPRWAVNCRNLEDFDLSKLKINQQYFMKDMPPKYEV